MHTWPTTCWLHDKYNTGHGLAKRSEHLRLYEIYYRIDNDLRAVNIVISH